MLASDSILLETAFAVFNKVYFENNLPKAVMFSNHKIRGIFYIETTYPASIYVIRNL